MSEPTRTAPQVSTRDALRVLGTIRTRRLQHGVTSRPFAAALLAAVSGAAASALLAPASLEATRAGAVTHWGGWPLETMFVVLVLGASLLTFRVVEILFRTDDAHALELLPIPGRAFAFDRTVVLARDGALLATVGTVSMLPLLVRPGASLAVAAIAFAWFGAVLIVLMAFGLIAAAGAATTDPSNQLARALDVSSERAGAVFHFAPGAAFGACAVLLLFAKLGFEEPLRAAAEGGALRVTRAAQVAAGIPLVLAALTFFSGVRSYARQHHELQARFREADAVAIGRYHEREAALEGTPRGEAATWRAATLAQLGRRHALLLPSSWIGGAAGVLIAWATRGTVPPAAFTGMACLWLALVVHPAARLAAMPEAAPFSLASALPGAADRERGKQAAVRDMVTRHLAPLLLPAVALGSWTAAATHVTAILACALAYAATASWTAPRRALAAAGAAALVVLPLSLVG